MDTDSFERLDGYLREGKSRAALHLALEELSKTPDDWNALYLHPTKNIRWRYPKRFPYRVIYEVIEDNRLVIIAAVIHAARHDRVWRGRV